MTILLPFFDALDPDINDGLLLSSVSPRQTNITWLASSVAAFPQRILKKDNRSESTQLWKDVTDTLTDVANGTVTCFNSPGDGFLIVLDGRDVIDKLEFLIKTAGIFDGDISIEVSYRRFDGTVVTVPGTVPDWRTPGLKTISHTPINAADIDPAALQTDELGDLHRYVIYTFKGMGNVTKTAGLSWLRKYNTQSSNTTVKDFSAAFSQGLNPIFNSTNVVIPPPIRGSRTILRVPLKISKLYSRIWRAPTGSFVAKLIYLSESGWKRFPTANIISLQSRKDSTSPLFTNGPATFDIDVFEDFVDTIIPPDDWTLGLETTPSGEQKLGYWFGWEFTEDAPGTFPGLLATVWSQSLHGTEVIGARPGHFQDTYKSAVITTQRPGAATTVLISNTRSNQTALAIIGDDARYSETVIDLANEEGDEYIFQVVRGGDLPGPMFGFIQLT